MRGPLASYVLLAVLLTGVAACGRAPQKEAKPPPVEEIQPAGWVMADTAQAVSAMYLDGAAHTSFALTCTKGSTKLRVMAPNPLDGATPAAAEQASLVLGVEPFVAPVAAATDGGFPFLVTDVPVTPQLLIALGDAKTARLLFRAGYSETGVDEDGKLVAFAARCATLSGVEPSL